MRFDDFTRLLSSCKYILSPEEQAICWRVVLSREPFTFKPYSKLGTADSDINVLLCAYISLDDALRYLCCAGLIP